MPEVFSSVPRIEVSSAEQEYQPLLAEIQRAERIYPTRSGYHHQTSDLPIGGLDVPRERSLESHGCRLTNFPKTIAVHHKNGHISFKGTEGEYRTTPDGKGYPALPSVVITQTEINGRPIHVCRFENNAKADTRGGHIEFSMFLSEEGGNLLVSLLQNGLDLPTFLEQAYLVFFDIKYDTQRLWENPPEQYMFVFILKQTEEKITPALIRNNRDGSSTPINVFLWQKGKTNHSLQYCR